MKESIKVGRRDFLAVAGAGLTLGFFIEEVPRVAEAATAGVAGPPANTQVNTWLNISSAGVVTLTIGSSEMGQGSFSGLAQILAEDLMVDYTKIQTVQGVPRNRRAGDRQFHRDVRESRNSEQLLDYAPSRRGRARDAGGGGDEHHWRSKPRQLHRSHWRNHLHPHQHKHQLRPGGCRSCEIGGAAQPSADSRQPVPLYWHHRQPSGYPLQGQRQRNLRSRRSLAKHGLCGDPAQPCLRRNVERSSSRYARRNDSGSANPDDRRDRTRYGNYRNG